MAEAIAIVTSTGKRKTAIARVRLQLGAGNITVNGRTLEDYFPREASRMVIHQPFEVVSGVGRYDVHAQVGGGGLSGQA
ncbi:MAG TPA: 30S ribosomal protein S9, partial [Myxococcota bacterium]